MGVLIGLAVAIGSLVSGYVAMGGHLAVIWQPWEYVSICGIAIGTFNIANPMSLVKDTGRGTLDAVRGTVPKRGQ